MIKTQAHILFCVAASALFFSGLISCKSKQKLQKQPETAVIDTSGGRCRLDFKTAKALTKHLKESAFNYDWIYAKAEVEAKVDSEDNSLDIAIRVKKDSAILISLKYLLGIEVGKVLITRDSVKMVLYPKKQYFRGDFNYINELLNADLDYDVVQALLFGNYAEFDDDESKLKPVTDRQNCRYLLSTERKRKLRRINNGQKELTKSLQKMTMNPDNFKILKNEFIDVETNRMFTAVYDKFVMKDSVYAPHLVNIDIVAEKKVQLKIDYVRIEKNQPQKLSINIPAKYEPIPVKKPK
ncbi:MAG: DUF4292 domain-containing protein [Bacteroidia bacterium]